MPARPNILLITSDQQHYDTLGVANPRIKTPALDRMAAEGTRFNRAYCPNPTCTPTRASIITGMYPSQHGAWSLGTKLFEDVPTVGHLLGGAGYATALIGKAHFQPLATRPGMESIECQPLMRQLDFWRKWHGPWYGFEHIETARNHTCESHAGQHYAVWMEDNGLANWRDYFVDWPHRPDDVARRMAQRHWGLPEKYHYTRWTAERTVAHIRQSLGQGRPFFTWASFMDPHPPYVLSEPWASMYDPDDMLPGRLHPGEHDRNPPHFARTQQPRPDWSPWNREPWIHGFMSHLQDEQELRRDMAIYYGMISFMDQQIGVILDELEAAGAAENTLVVFTTDHGHFLGQHGLIAKGPFHYEDMIRIPFIVRRPGRTPAGRVSRDIQSLVDLAPTFLAAAGVEAPGVMTGLDQSASWSGGGPVRRWAIVENHHTPTTVHLRTYVEDRYKITVYRDCQAGGGHGEADYGELFDLQADPGELHNLWHDPAAQPIKTALLHRFLQATIQSEPMRMPRIWGA